MEKHLDFHFLIFPTLGLPQTAFDKNLGKENKAWENELIA